MSLAKEIVRATTQGVGGASFVELVAVVDGMLPAKPLGSEIGEKQDIHDIELAACGSCGGDHLVVYWDILRGSKSIEQKCGIQCTCGVSFFGFDDPHKLVAAWNNRADQAGRTAAQALEADIGPS